MKRIIFTIITVLCAVWSAEGQTVKGHIYDAQTREPLIGATVSYSNRRDVIGVATDHEGTYVIYVPDGGATLIYNFLGYEEQHLPVVVDARETTVRDVYMAQETKLLENVVVSAGRFEQKLSEVTVSMDVMSKADLARQVPTDLGVALSTLPGVDVNDNQPSIRGGAGWGYGVGSRSLLLVDGLDVIGAANGAINWSLVPMENIEQVEVIKGASSVLYGSSALNGLINVRMGRPGLVPKTNVKFYAGVYGNPSNEDYIWWNKALWTEGQYAVKPFLRNSFFTGIRNPMFEGLEATHSRRLGNFDITGGLNFLNDEGYREQGYRKRFRIGGNLTYHHPGENIITYGANVNYMYDKNGDFLLWRSPKKALSPSSVTNMGREDNVFTIDPFFNFINHSNNTAHRIKARFSYEGNNIVMATESKSILDIIGSMGADINEVGNLVGTITDVLDGNLGGLAGILPPVIEGDVSGLMDGLFGYLGKVFPTANNSDYIDLIAWFMNNGLPLGDTNIVTWLADAVNPKQDQTLISKNYTYYGDYQFNKSFDEGQVTFGTTYRHIQNNSQVTGMHASDNISLFVQYDHRFFDRLSVSAGMRAEYFRVDEFKREAETKIFGVKMPFKPIFRGGLNYQFGKYSFIRTSFGQGYRYPSLTEKYARRDIGGVGVYPNSKLKAETGLNAEIGIIQGYKIGPFQGFVDIAGFYTQYKNMIEFNIGFFNNETFENIRSVGQLVDMVANGQMPGLGAQYYNIGRARISGLDISTTGTYNISPGSKFLYNIGYIYLEPTDPDYKKKNEQEAQYSDPLQFKEKSNESKYLKYRQRHTFKASIDYEYKRVTIGTNITWKSETLASDFIFIDDRARLDDKPVIMDYVRELLFGAQDGESLASYWDKHNKPYCVMDTRIGVKANDKLHFQFMVSNLLNTEYSLRPMALAPQRTFVLTVNYTF